MDAATILTLVITILSSTALAATITGIVTWRVQSAAQRQSKLIETTRLFMEMAALAHARDPQGKREAIGLSEMIAAIEIVAALGVNYKPIKPAAIAFLDAHIISYSDESRWIADPALESNRTVIVDASKAARARFK